MRPPQTLADAGSSPLARGLLADASQSLELVGIIPARAGFTACSSGARRTEWDHPRSRGVYPSGCRLPAHAGGSSPLARGLHFHTPNPPSRRWIIPARAGFTSIIYHLSIYLSDHPRSRGVYCAWADSLARLRGSSPLARGLRPLVTMRVTGVGIIPARAGFTREPVRAL